MTGRPAFGIRAGEPEMRQMASIAGWAAVAVGAVHTALAVAMFRRPSLDALWFAGSGLAVVLIGALTLVARRAPVRGVATAANGAGLVLAVAFGVLTRWHELQGPLLAIIFLAGGVAVSRPAGGIHDAR
jgi:cytochrome b561